MSAAPAVPFVPAPLDEREHTEGWEAPVPLDSGNAPAFPLDALPPVLAKYVRAVAAFTEVPVDLPAVLSLAVVAASGARKVRVIVRPGYTEPVNVFVVVSMPPGSRKSAVFAEVVAPLVDFERELLDRMGPEIAEAQSRGRVREKELAHAEAMAAKGGQMAVKWHHDRRDLARQIRETATPAEPRVLMADATPEAVAAGLADQGGAARRFFAGGRCVFPAARPVCKRWPAQFRDLPEGARGRRTARRPATRAARYRHGPRADRRPHGAAGCTARIGD